MYVSPDTILRAVTRVTGVSLDALRSETRPRHLADARKIASWLLRHKANRTNEQIGALLNRTHTSASWAVYACEDCRATDANFRRLFEAALATLAAVDAGQEAA